MSKKTIPVPTENQFSLSKVKMLKDIGLEVHFEVNEVINEQSYTNEHHYKSAKEVHPDLKALFVRLVPIMGRIYNITSFLSMIDVKDFKATEKQKQYSQEFAKEALKAIEVRGVSFSGQDDNVGVVLSGVFTVSNNQKTALNSPRLKFSSETFGFEEELEEIVGDIEREVYAFLFKGKKADLELFGADNEPIIQEEEIEEDATLFPVVKDPAEEEETDEIDTEDNYEDYDTVGETE